MESAKSPIPAAVLVEQFTAKATQKAVFLTLFGLGVRSAAAPLEETPVCTAVLSPQKALELASLLTKAANASTTLTADPARPQ